MTIAAASRYVAASDWPPTRDQQEEQLARELDAALDFLNDFLVGLSLIRADPRIQPVSRGDLWAACPVILEASPSPTAKPVGTTFLTGVHRDIPDLPFESEPAVDGAAEAATVLATSERRGEEPFFLFYALMQRALLERGGHRSREAVLFLGIAVEVLLSVVLRECPSGTKPTGRGLKGRVQNHLAACANIAANPDDPTTSVGRWWAGGYVLRNRVAHEGYKPSDSEVESAFEDGNELVISIRDGLRGSPSTEALGRKLEWGRMEERPEDWYRSMGATAGQQDPPSSAEIEDG